MKIALIIFALICIPGLASCLYIDLNDKNSSELTILIDVVALILVFVMLFIIILLGYVS